MPVCEFVWATLMKDHSLGDLTAGPASLEARVWVQGVRRPGFPRGLSPGVCMAVFSGSSRGPPSTCVCVLISFVEFGSTVMPHFTLVTFLKTFPPNTATF